MNAKTESKNGRDVAGRLLQKALMPIVATAASAAATYAAKKGPELFEEKLGPKMRELVNGGAGSVSGLPGKARAAAGDAGDVAEKLTERVRSVAGSAAESTKGAVGNATSSNGHRHDSMSSKEYQRRREERDKARRARRKASR
jgi:hypothetical protein